MQRANMEAWGRPTPSALDAADELERWMAAQRVRQTRQNQHRPIVDEVESYVQVRAAATPGSCSHTKLRVALNYPVLKRRPRV